MAVQLKCFDLVFLYSDITDTLNLSKVENDIPKLYTAEPHIDIV